MKRFLEVRAAEDQEILGLQEFAPEHIAAASRAKRGVVDLFRVHDARAGGLQQKETGGLINRFLDQHIDQRCQQDGGRRADENPAPRLQHAKVIADVRLPLNRSACGASALASHGGSSDKQCPRTARLQWIA